MLDKPNLDPRFAQAVDQRGRDLPLQFAPWQMAMRIVGAPKGVKTWHCPCHDDEHPSFSAKPGREPGVTVVTCGAGCSQDDLLAHFRKLGYRLGPMRRALAKRPARPVDVATSVAFRAVTRAAQKMYALIATGDNPTYNDFVAGRVRRESIPGGLRELQALGLIGVIRRPRKQGCLQYERNESWPAHQWGRWEPSGKTKGAMNAAIDRAKAVAKAAHNGGEDISQPAAKNRSQPVSGHLEFLLSEVPVRGTVFGTESYVDRTLGSRTQDSIRPTNGREVPDSGRAGAEETVPPPPPPAAGDPGPSEEGDYGAAPPASQREHGKTAPGKPSETVVADLQQVKAAKASEQAANAAADWQAAYGAAPVAGFCRYACGKAGECTASSGICVKQSPPLSLCLDRQTEWEVRIGRGPRLPATTATADAADRSEASAA